MCVVLCYPMTLVDATGAMSVNQDDLEIFAARIVVDPRRSYKVSSYENGTLLEASEKKGKKIL